MTNHLLSFNDYDATSTQGKTIVTDKNINEEVKNFVDFLDLLIEIDKRIKKENETNDKQNI